MMVGDPPCRVITGKKIFSPYILSQNYLPEIKLHMEKAARRKYVASFIQSLPKKGKHLIKEKINYGKSIHFPQKI